MDAQNDKYKMIFIDNKYTKWYNAIVDRAKKRVTSGYTEKHHIIPKSLRGSNESFNLVKLTAREHFVCHLLLVRMVNGTYKRKMSYALWLMCNLKNHLQLERHIPNSTTYENVRKTHSVVVSETFKGVKKTYSSFSGRTHTEKTLLLQSIIKLGEKNPNFGKVQKPEWNAGKSKSQIGIKKPIITCKVCGISVGGHGNYIRWHGSNCKLNTSI